MLLSRGYAIREGSYADASIRRPLALPASGTASSTEARGCLAGSPVVPPGQALGFLVGPLEVLGALPPNSLPSAQCAGVRYAPALPVPARPFAGPLNVSHA